VPVYVGQTSSNGVDLRRYQRIAVPGDAGIRVFGRPPGPDVEGNVTVISVNGMFCRTHANVAVGTVLELVLQSPAVSVELQGTVRHANEQGMGIEFTGCTEENKRRLEDLLLRLRA